VHRQQSPADEGRHSGDVLKEAAGVRQVVLLDQRLVHGEAIAPSHACIAQALHQCIAATTYNSAAISDEDLLCRPEHQIPLDDVPWIFSGQVGPTG